VIARRRSWWWLLPPLVAAPVAVGQQPSPRPVQAVDSVDFTRYVGRWYEIAKFPNRFQHQCRAETTADYTLRPDGTLQVVNQCRTAAGDTSRAAGTARLAKRSGPTSKLKVRFAPGVLAFLPFVWGDYWILDLDPAYRVVLVGNPGRDYLWVLSRTPQLDDSTYARLRLAAAAQGFDTTRLEPSTQAGSR
jgi:apolipoprotein D and lipocalin family protein